MTTSELPRVPAIVCTPWCVHGDGHPEDWCVEDQTCYGDRHRIPAQDGVGEPGEFQVMPHRGQESVESNVCINVNLKDVDVDVYLTVDQARVLAESLMTVTDVVEGTG